MSDLLSSIKNLEKRKASGNKQQVVCYHKSFSNPSIYPKAAKAKIVRTLKQISKQELLDIKSKLLTCPRHKRQLEAIKQLQKFYQKHSDRTER